MKGNKGEWGERYASIRILGDGRLYMADEKGKKNTSEWMDVLELIRYEAVNSQRKEISYKRGQATVDIYVDGLFKVTVDAVQFTHYANLMLQEINSSSTRQIVDENDVLRRTSLELSQKISDFLYSVEFRAGKAASTDKSDIFVTVNDPRTSVTRARTGFSIKSEFGQNPTLFNTARGSAMVYRVEGMNDWLMHSINAMVDSKGHAAVSARCQAIKEHGCSVEFVGTPIVARTNQRTFGMNLDIINERLLPAIAEILYNHFFEGFNENDVKPAVEKLARENPFDIPNATTRYPFMFKQFLYAAYSGMTASTPWDGTNRVNGGFIKVTREGDVLAYYAVESDPFKDYLYNNCYFEYPSTSAGHGDYAYVFKEGNEYYFKLNFQIRYR